jgi:ribosomal protein L32
MSVRMRHTRSHSNNRRSHHALTAASAVKDKESGALRLPHRLDESTGMYRGKQILPKARQHKHENDHDHAAGAKEPIHTEKETKKTGVLGRMTKGKAKARSGMGGGV